MNCALLPRPTGTIRARSHPWAILAVAAWQAVLALLGAYPAASLARAAYGNDPRGDAVLWEPGAHALLDLLMRDSHGVSAALGEASLVLIVGAIAGLVPLAALLTAMAFCAEDGRGLDGATILAASARSLRPLALLLAAVTALEAIAIAMTVAVYDVVDALLSSWLGEAHAQIAAGLFATPVLTLAIALGVTHDLSRAAVVAQRSSAFRAFITAMDTFRSAPIALTWSWAWRGLGSFPAVLAVAALASRVGGRGALALLVLGALHQGVIVTRSAFRASWLAKALRVVDRPSAP